MEFEKDGAEIFDFQAFKTRKALKGERKSGLQQAFKVPENTSDIRGLRPVKGTGDADLAARIERIKSSISRINELMAELKSMSPNQEPKN